MEVAILGGTGFVGSRLAKYYKNLNANVYLINRGSREISGTTSIKCDRNKLVDIKNVGENLPNIDLLIDCSSYTMEQTKSANESLGHKVKHWIHISSASVYSTNENHAHNETDPISGAPVWGDYGKQKSEIDSYLISSNFKGRVSILRPPYIYGLGNDSDRETFVWARCRRKEPIFIPADGSILMQFIDVDDLAEITHRLNLVSSVDSVEVYNIGNPYAISQLEWVKVVAKAAGYEAKTIVVKNHEDRLSGYSARCYFPLRDYPCYLDTSKINKILKSFKYSPFDLKLSEIYEGTSLALLDKGNLPSDVENILSHNNKQGV